MINRTDSTGVLGTIMETSLNYDVHISCTDQCTYRSVTGIHCFGHEEYSGISKGKLQ